MKVSTEMHLEGDLHEHDLLHIKIDITLDKIFFWGLITQFYQPQIKQESQLISHGQPIGDQD